MLEQEFLEKYEIKIEEAKQKLLGKQGKNVLVEGKTGSGKTFLLLTRIAYLQECEDVKPSEMLNLTTTLETAKDAAVRYRQLGLEQEVIPQFHDIHQIAYRIIRKHDQMHEQESWKAYRDVRKLIARLVNDMFALTLSDLQLSKLIETMSYCRNMMLLDKDIAQMPVIKGIDLCALLKSYDRYKQRQHMYDYDDLLVKAFEIIMKNPDVLQLFHDRYRYIHVDDAQNLSYISHIMLKVLAKNCEVFMCANDDYVAAYEQAPYREALSQFSETYAPAAHVLLTHNYRNNKTISETANHFYFKDKEGLAIDSDEECDIRYKGFADCDKLYAYALRKAQDEEESVFLYHHFASAIPLIDALQQEGINFMYDGNIDHFMKHVYVKDLCNFIELMIDARDMRAFYEIHAKMGLDVSKRVLLEISERIKQDEQVDVYQALMESGYKAAGKKKLASLMELIRKVQSMPTEKMIYFIQEKLNYHQFMQKAGIQGNDAIVLGFTTLAQRYENPEEFLLKLNKLQDMVTPNSARVQIRSIKGCAGKEFDRVFMLDCIQSIWNKGAVDEVEQQRMRSLFYIGMTRAKHQLEFFSAKRSSVTRLEILSFLYELNTPKEDDTAINGEGTDKVSSTPKKLREGSFRRGMLIQHVTLGDGKIMKVTGGMMHVQFVEELKQLNIKMCLNNNLIELKN